MYTGVQNSTCTRAHSNCGDTERMRRKKDREKVQSRIVKNTKPPYLGAGVIYQIIIEYSAVYSFAGNISQNELGGGSRETVDVIFHYGDKAGPPVEPRYSNFKRPHSAEGRFRSIPWHRVVRRRGAHKQKHRTFHRQLRHEFRRTWSESSPPPPDLKLTSTMNSLSLCRYMQYLYLTQWQNGTRAVFGPPFTFSIPVRDQLAEDPRGVDLILEIYFSLKGPISTFEQL